MCQIQFKREPSCLVVWLTRHRPVALQYTEVVEVISIESKKILLREIFYDVVEFFEKQYPYACRDSPAPCYSLVQNPITIFPRNIKTNVLLICPLWGGSGILQKGSRCGGGTNSVSAKFEPTISGVGLLVGL